MANASLQYDALIVVDMQNDFCCDNGAMHQLGADIAANKRVAAALAEFVHSVRANGVSVVWLRQSTSPWVVSRAREERATGTWGAELIPEACVRSEDLVVDKPTYSGFVGTGLDKALRARNFKHLLLCGTAANVCVDSTARSAYMLDYEVTLVRDLLGWTQEELAKYAILNLERYFCSIRSSAQVLNGRSS